MQVNQIKQHPHTEPVRLFDKLAQIVLGAVFAVDFKIIVHTVRIFWVIGFRFFLTGTPKLSVLRVVLLKNRAKIHNPEA